MDVISDRRPNTMKRSNRPLRVVVMLISCVMALCMFARPARADLQRSWTAVGFFEYVYANTTGAARTDAATALAVIKNSAASSYENIHVYTSIGNAYDASSLYCVYTGLAYLDYCNTIRSSRGLSAFGTNCTMEAMSIVMCNYSQRFGGHSNAYFSSGVHEALAWGGGQRSTSSVYQSWYYGESDSGSHRRNVIGSYNASGFAIAANGSGTMTYMYEQSFLSTSSSAKVYSISAFRQLLGAYISRCLAEGMPLGSLPSSLSSGVSTAKNGLYVENGVTHGYSNGEMLVNAWGHFDGKYYYFGATGAMETSTWIKSGGKWYWLGSNGAMAANTWVSYNGYSYWLGSDGAMATSSWVYYKNNWYWVNSNGYAEANAWIKEGGKWYWVGSDGALVTNSWHAYGNTWYYLGEDGALAISTWVYYKGSYYWIGEDGTMATDSWVRYGGSWYWVGSDGVPYTNKWLAWEGTWYYFGANGRLVAS